MLERGGAGGGGQALGEVAVLGGVGDAVERAEALAAGAPGVRGLGVGAGVRVHHDERVERGGGAGTVVRLDPREVGVEQADRGGAARLQRGPQVGDTGLDDVERVGHGVRLQGGSVEAEGSMEQVNR